MFMEAYYQSVALLEGKIDSAIYDGAKLRWLERYFIVVLEEDQKEKYKELYNKLKKVA